MRFDLYRFLDGSGQLLYVGQTSELKVRMRAHKERTPWIDEVQLVHVVTDFESLEQLSRAEAVAIRYEKPKYNMARPIPSRYLHEEAKRRGRPRKTEDGFDKAAWQREYMRKRRAKAKAK